MSLLACSAIASPAWAAESQPLNLPESKPSQPVALDSGSYLIKTLLALAAVILVIWVAYKILKKLSLKSSTSGRGPAVEVLSRTQLDREMAIYVLRLGSQVSVVSRSGGGSAVLSSMSEEEAEQIGLTKAVNQSDQRLKTIFAELKSRVSPSQASDPLAVEELLGDPDQLLAQEFDLYVGDQGAATVDELLEQEEQ